MSFDEETLPFDFMLPEWAESRTDGECMRCGAVLATRDGRRTGNATVIGIEMRGVEHGDGMAMVEVALVITDAGNQMYLNHNELKELFWPPQWIKSREYWPLITDKTVMHRRAPPR